MLLVCRDSIWNANVVYSASEQIGLWKCLSHKTKGSPSNIDTSTAVSTCLHPAAFPSPTSSAAVTLCSMMATKTMSWTLVWDVEAAAPSATPSAGGQNTHVTVRCSVQSWRQWLLHRWKYSDYYEPQPQWLPDKLMQLLVRVELHLRRGPPDPAWWWSWMRRLWLLLDLDTQKTRKESMQLTFFHTFPIRENNDKQQHLKTHQGVILLFLEGEGKFSFLLGNLWLWKLWGCEAAVC